MAQMNITKAMTDAQRIAVLKRHMKKINNNFLENKIFCCSRGFNRKTQKYSPNKS